MHDVTTVRGSNRFDDGQYKRHRDTERHAVGKLGQHRREPLPFAHLLHDKGDPDLIAIQPQTHHVGVREAGQGLGSSQ